MFTNLPCLTMTINIISEYNEEYTKECLTNFWFNYIWENSNDNLKSENIYNALGTENNDKYTRVPPLGGNDFFQRLIEKNGFPQTKDRNWDFLNPAEKLDGMLKAYSQGTYFHLPCTTSLKGRTNRRILLNTLYNQPSSEVLMDVIYGCCVNRVYTQKCFLKQGQEQGEDSSLKLDKVVIYLPEEDLQFVIENLCCLLRKTSKKITPFCQLSNVKENPGLYFGIAPHKSGTSFVQSLTLFMIEFLSNIRYAKYENGIIVDMRKIKEKYKDKREQFVSDCYEFVIARVKALWNR